MLRRILMGLAVTVAALLLIGLVLPSTASLSRSVTVAATPEQVYPLVAAPRAWTRWAVWNRRDTAMAVAYELSFEGWDRPSTGDLTLVSEGTGTTVTWRMEARFGRSPVERWFGLLVPRLVGPDFEAGLANLKALVEAPY